MNNYLESYKKKIGTLHDTTKPTRLPENEDINKNKMRRINYTYTEIKQNKKNPGFASLEVSPQLSSRGDILSEDTLKPFFRARSWRGIRRSSFTFFTRTAPEGKRGAFISATAIVVSTTVIILPLLLVLRCNYCHWIFIAITILLTEGVIKMAAKPFLSSIPVTAV